MSEQGWGVIERLLRLVGAVLVVVGVALAFIPLSADLLGVSYSCGGGALTVWDHGSTWVPVALGNPASGDPVCFQAAVGRLQVALGLGIGGMVLALGAGRLVGYLAGV